MKHSTEVGFCFGSTSGIVTTLGLMVGLYSGTNSKAVVFGGILTIAIADAFSDALGIHMSEESEHRHSKKQIWMSTFYTFLTKFITALIFVVPVLLFDLKTAIIVSVVLGLALLGEISNIVAKKEKENRFHVIFEHIMIAVIVITITYFVGQWISQVFI